MESDEKQTTYTTARRRVALNRRSGSVAAVATLLGIVLAGTAGAGFDGFNVDSSSFAHEFLGTDIFNANTLLFGDDWNLAGGASTSSLSNDGTTLVANNDANNGWLEQNTGASPWEVGVGSWSLEVRAKLTDTNGNDDGLTIWTDLNAENHVIWIQDDSINLLDGTELLGGIDNTDGFHDFRVAYDADAGSYHVWRDGVFATTPGGLKARAPAGDPRLIIGDCCTGIGNPVDQWEIDYVRYDMNGAFSPADVNTLTLQINMLGEATLINSSSLFDFDVRDYSITSASGQLLPGNWTSLESQGVGDDGLPNNGVGFEVLGTPSTASLAEANLFGSQIFTQNSSFSLGAIFDTNAGAGDLQLRFRTTDGALVSGFVEYNVSPPDLFGDLTADGRINLLDWIELKANYGLDTSALDTEQQYDRGDLDASGAINLADFLIFRAEFDAANGPGAFAALSAQVPEPAAWMLIVALALPLSLAKRLAPVA